MWVVYAGLSAFFAALVAVLAKMGISGVSSNVAVAIRTIVVLIIAWIIVFITGQYKELGGINSKSFWFLILSGVATGLSWLCYFKAIQIGDVTKVVVIDKFSVVITLVLAALLLGEAVGWKGAVGGALVTAGMLVIVL